MKMKFHLIYTLALSSLFFSCDKDNYTAPKSELAGQIVYKGEPVGVEFAQVRVQLWQPGFGKLAAIDAGVSQDGAYSALLFNGDYKLVFPKGDGPFKTIVKDAAVMDTLFVKVAGNQKLDLEVLPYYMIRNTKFSGGESKVSVSLKLEKIITGVDSKEIERVSLYVNTSQFVSRGVNISVKDVNGSDIKDLNTISLITTVPALPKAQNYVYARVGVKIRDVEDMVFSTVEKVQL